MLKTKHGFPIAVKHYNHPLFNFIKAPFFCTDRQNFQRLFRKKKY